MSKQLEKNYDHLKVEEGKYDFWLEKQYFVSQDHSKPSFSMIIPPPNVTGILHIGHAKNTSTLDVIARYKRLCGFDVMWLPGMDHAGIATQAKVEKKLKEEGISKYDLGREKFLKEVWKWKDDYASYIRKQWCKLGLSLDYSRERFTLDDMTSTAVNKVFVKLYNEGLIYQGERIINWDPELQTALSNIEVEHKDIKGKFYYFKYRFVDSPNDYLQIATTRPETMFGDTCVVFNPKDERYAKYEGKLLINPANGDKIPLISDYYVDKEFGTGAMKCTPAHDPNDFEIAKRHNLKLIVCINKDGTMNDKANIYKGLDRFDCRKKLVKQIEEQGDLIKIEDIVHSVGHSERSGVIVEPYLSKQWFIKMKPLAKKTLDIQDSDDKVEFIPPRFEKILVNWMDNCEDWCISRQLWWGHRIPVYYKKGTNEMLVLEEPPADIENYCQDEDVLDTWFSSALSPFATLGWPNEESEDFKRFFPLDVMVTAYDIIFFWVARMIFQSLHFTNKIPFKKVLIHGLIRDSQGRKMSKSLGNGIDPNDVIKQYGTDSLRYFLVSTGAPGLDSCYQEEKVNAAHNFLNKIWNVTRFALSYLPADFKEITLTKDQLSDLDSYVFTELNETIDKVKYNMEKYEIAQACTYLYNFVYDTFCSWYLELVKVDLKNGSYEKQSISYQVIYKVLKAILIMLHPYVPFITEELYQSLPNSLESIMVETYPTSSYPTNGTIIINDLIKMITDIRLFKVNAKLAPNANINLVLKATKHEKDIILPYLERFSFSKNIVISDEINDGMKYGDMSLAITQVSDELAKEKIEKRKEFLADEIARCEKMLNNANFVNKAPKEKIELEQSKLEQFKKELASY